MNCLVYGNRMWETKCKKKKRLHHRNMIHGRYKVGIRISSISRQVFYHVLPGIMLLKAMVRWPMKSWPIGSWSHTRKRTSASSGMWTVKTSVSSHMGLNPAGPSQEDGEKRGKKEEELWEKAGETVWQIMRVRQLQREERKCDRDGEWTVQDRDREWAQHSSIIQGAWADWEVLSVYSSLCLAHQL